MEPMSCGVLLDYIIPLDLEATPYILLCSRGEHTHPPPPTNTVPLKFIDAIAKLIDSVGRETNGLTTGESNHGMIVVHQLWF